ncbi:MAG: hypothetical protein GEU94_09170 [Micromonosporaceae bacterium]|nr:hypothetical protein [Micromonosporaceae bacterium]
MKAHGTDAASLVFGVLFLGIAGWWLLADFTGWELSVSVIAWLAAGLLIVVGVLGITTAIRSSRDRESGGTNMLSE